MQADVSQPRRYKHTIDALRSIINKEGFIGLYKVHNGLFIEQCKFNKILGSWSKYISGSSFVSFKGKKSPIDLF